jgi:hypothetical protein
MTIQIEHLAPRLPARLHRVLEARFDGDPRAPGLCTEFLSRAEYDRRLVRVLLGVSDGSAGDSWNIRTFAILMLANQCRLLDPGNEGEFKFLFRKFGILSADGKRMVDGVLREGYTSTDCKVFIAQFLGNLNRLERIHRRIQGPRTTSAALNEFICLSRQPCKVSLARYLFSPAEVLERLLDDVKVSSGVRSSIRNEGRREAELYRSRLPDYESKILDGLTASGWVYWVSARTPSEINSLIENPIETVACVVKPPGSPWEFEIKRTGLRAMLPLTAAFTYDTGEPLPPSHRLQGGAITASLLWESTQAARFSEIYRLAHGSEAPVSKLLALARYKSVPMDGAEINLLDYFTNPAVFGDAYAEMREHMALCVSAFDQQFGNELGDVPGEVGLTGRFLVHAMPCQGIFAQTSSYRLDRLSTLLSPAGPDIYFKKGLQRKSYSRHEAQLFADALLDEILGVYLAPDVIYEDHAQYLRAAWAIPENRIRADRYHASTISDLGMLWGTLLAQGGYSFGESFVARNLGLKCSFVDGEWTVRLFCMDHDNLHIVDEEEEWFWPHPTFRASVVDECFICANPGRPRQIEGSSLWCIEQIYQVDSENCLKSKTYLHQGMEKGYKQTRRGMDQDPGARRLFSKSYIRHLHDWDVIVADYLTICGNSKNIADWKKRTESYLASRNYRKDVIANYLEAVAKHDDVIDRYSFLYLPGTT